MMIYIYRSVLPHIVKDVIFTDKSGPVFQKATHESIWLHESTIAFIAMISQQIGFVDPVVIQN